jgi:hypothetical protein
MRTSEAEEGRNEKRPSGGREGSEHPLLIEPALELMAKEFHLGPKHHAHAKETVPTVLLATRITGDYDRAQRQIHQQNCQ